MGTGKFKVWWPPFAPQVLPGWINRNLTGAPEVRYSLPPSPLAHASLWGMEKVNLAEKFSLFNDYWKPKIVGELNSQQVKLVKFLGPFVWHYHEAEDEMFLVVKGRFRMEFRDKHVWLEEGEFVIVPRGIEHRPVAEAEVHVLLFEPSTTLNTGNVQNDMTARALESI
jgi:mannose-6-phosphate isomerase-like protein (cupin superfamily)